MEGRQGHMNIAATNTGAHLAGFLANKDNMAAVLPQPNKTWDIKKITCPGNGRHMGRAPDAGIGHHQGRVAGGSAMDRAGTGGTSPGPGASGTPAGPGIRAGVDGAEARGVGHKKG